MTIQELSSLIGKSLVVRYVAGRGDGIEWYASIERCEVKEGSMLISRSGNGNSPNEAIHAYVKNIKGQKIVVDAGLDTRKEYHVPETLTYHEEGLV